MCDRHPPFDLAAGDRATPRDGGVAAAVERARGLAVLRRQRQRVTIHNGDLLRGAFFIQDAERVEAWRADR